MTSSRAAKGAFLSVVAIALLGALAFLYSRTEAIDFKKDAEVLSLLRELKEIDTRWDADAGRLATGGSPGADRGPTLARILRELDRATGRPEVAAALPAIREGMAGKSAAWEELKARHAKSASAFAEAASAAATLAPERPAPRRSLRRPRRGSQGPRRRGEGGGGGRRPARGTDRHDRRGRRGHGPGARGARGARRTGPAGAPRRARGGARRRPEIRLPHRGRPRRPALADDLALRPGRARGEGAGPHGAAALLVGVGWLAARVIAAQAALREANLGLEKRVKERTRELSEALVRLKESEAQLVQSEKMSSLGQMVAGVAHEINTPLAYVKNSVATVRDRLPELEGALGQAERLMALLQSEAPDPSQLQEAFGELSSRLARLREHHVLGDIESLAKDGLHGIEQIGELVVNLRNFSRLDRSRVASFNVNEGVNATLVIAKPQLRGVTLERRLGEIPSITCSPSQVNQVLLNLVTNAAQALDKPEKVIVVTTRREGDTAIAIEVADNGKGIPAEVLPRIFDPFYTTKEVGKGTGLGLSIAYKIVAEHGGRIDVHSTPGKGTVFTVVLPFQPPAELAAGEP